MQTSQRLQSATQGKNIQKVKNGAVPSRNFIPHKWSPEVRKHTYIPTTGYGTAIMLAREGKLHQYPTFRHYPTAQVIALPGLPVAAYALVQGFGRLKTVRCQIIGQWGELLGGPPPCIPALHPDAIQRKIRRCTCHHTSHVSPHSCSCPSPPQPPMPPNPSRSTSWSMATCTSSASSRRRTAWTRSSKPWTIPG